MKNLNKICLKQKYWGYFFKFNQENKLQELMITSYSVLFEDMTDKNWALGKKIRKKNGTSYKHCNKCRRIYLSIDYKIKNKTL